MIDLVSQKDPVPIGRFLLFKSLKKGGMARVFLGVDPSEPETLYAIKTLLPKLAKEPTFQKMFASEGKIGMRLSHPNIVETVEFGDHEGTAFIAMRFISGFDLSSVIRRLRKPGSETIPIRLSVTMARDVAAALAYAHDLTDEFSRPLNIVNRDISPGNVMIDLDGTVKLIDFGIAQTTIAVKSQIGTIKGKISYMAPEQVRGLPVDHRSDLFSLGTVLYEMLTMVQIFHDDGDFATMERVRRAEAPPPSAHNAEVDPELDRIVLKAMARDRIDRHARADDLRRDLDRWLDAHGGPASPEDFARFMRSLFNTQAEQLLNDINVGLRAALGPTEDTKAGVERPRFITEDALAAFDTEASIAPVKVTPPKIQTKTPSLMVWAGVLLAAAVGAAVWLGLR